MMDDLALVTRIRQGDHQAFKLLIKQYERLVAHMIGRLVHRTEDREELCQDVFLKVYEKIGAFNFQSKLSTWIATIAYRQGVDHLRKQKLFFIDIPEEESFANRFVSDENPEEHLSNEDLDKWVMTLIDLLPPQYKVVLTLYHVESMNYHEIGEVTGMPEGTVKNYLFRARFLLKERVKKVLGKEELL